MMTELVFIELRKEPIFPLIYVYFLGSFISFV